MRGGATELKIEIIRNFSTQSDFAQRVGCHESKVSQVLNGRRKLGREDAKRWIKILECDADTINPFIDNKEG